MKHNITLISALGLGLIAMGAVGCSSNPNANSQEDQNVAANQESQRPYSEENIGENNAAVQASAGNNNGAMDQGESSSDINITSQIRRRIMNQSLSVDAQNITITTRNGQVTLRGRVDSQGEKDVIGRIAGDAAQPQNVNNELFVQPRE